MDYYDIPRTDVLELVNGPRCRILDIGCGKGATIKLFRKRDPGASIVGVELKNALPSVSSETILQGSIDDHNIRSVLSDSQVFDLILMLDILEHLVDPWQTLCYVKTLLAKEGQIIVSIPNVSNLKVLAPLIFGNRFAYAEAGILDRTHLRFFTSTSAIEMMVKAGLDVERLASSGPTRLRRVRSLPGLISYLANLATFGMFERFVAHQWLIVASHH